MSISTAFQGHTSCNTGHEGEKIWFDYQHEFWRRCSSPGDGQYVRIIQVRPRGYERVGLAWACTLQYQTPHRGAGSILNDEF